ncbi:SRPBCC domain-containing protein [Rhodoligotrophos ferricapiens]|uniref:SRPBCC domain-containing protein n=1 Tax=Rhodoligotrophos ferricapiens TaxID=3069264 RepID=UPI00315D920E
MSEKGEVSSLSCLTFRRILPGPVERVWAHLTDTRLLPSWFGDDSSIEPRPGGTVRIMGGHVRGIVTQWQPCRKLVYTWNVFDPNDGPDAVSAYPESYPTFELGPSGADVVLTFKHFPIPERFIAQSAVGWHSMLDILSAALKGERVEDRSVYSQKNAAVYGVDLANLAR